MTLLTIPPVRQRLIELMAETVADEKAHGTWDYRAVRPAGVPAAWHPGQRVVGDCSKGVQYLCRWAGAPDPMRNNFGVYGNSQTLWAVLRPTILSQLEPGDIVLFGADGKDHAAMVYQAGQDPMLWSFGHQGAPNFYPLSADRRQSFFRSLMVDPAPTPADRLRAQTSFYAWVAWKLGEGDWHSHKPADPAVRPNVPRVISHTWWVRYARFLLNRKHGNQPKGG